MSQPFTNRVWSGAAFTLHNAPTALDHYDWTDPYPIPVCTLLRTIIWASFTGYHQYEIGSGGSVNPLIGFALADTNSQNFNGNHPSDFPGNPYVDLIATASGLMDYTAISSPPDSTGSLTGSVNDISSSATLTTEYNVNTFLYGTKTMHVDSNSQRIFVHQPQYTFQSLALSSGFDHGQSMDIYVQVRMLYKQST